MKKTLLTFVSATLLLSSCNSGPSNNEGSPPTKKPKPIELQSYKGTWEWAVADKNEKLLDKGVAVLFKDVEDETVKGTLGVFSSGKIKKGMSIIGKSKKSKGQPLVAIFTESMSKDAKIYIGVQDANSTIEEQDGKPVFAGTFKSADNKDLIFVAIRVSQKTEQNRLNLMDKIDLDQINLDQQIFRRLLEK